jgi:hypothetical protein
MRIAERTRNPFQTHPSYRAIAHLPLKERLARLRQSEVRAGPLRRRRALRHHLRCELSNLSADALDARPQARQKAPNPLRDRGAITQDRTLGRTL